ncbi:MAG: hypothetical protein AAGF71_07890 [Pseudomonadota bacterium]
MRVVVVGLVGFMLTGCATRTLTETETAFLQTTHGDAFRAENMRVTKGALVGSIPLSRPTRPPVACREKIWPPETGGTVSTRIAGMVLFRRLLVARWYYRDDFVGGYPDALPLPDAMFLAHEATHVWQWQARAMTGYAPWKAAAEHVQSKDPYLFALEPDVTFLDYGYEQQASLVEEFVCCRALDPDGARTDRLKSLLEPVFPDLVETEIADRVLLPWEDAKTRGICS